LCTRHLYIKRASDTTKGRPERLLLALALGTGEPIDPTVLQVSEKAEEGYKGQQNPKAPLSTHTYS
jgi:hypothetical protein